MLLTLSSNEETISHPVASLNTGAVYYLRIFRTIVVEPSSIRGEGCRFPILTGLSVYRYFKSIDLYCSIAHPSDFFLLSSHSYLELLSSLHIVAQKALRLRRVTLYSGNSHGGDHMLPCERTYS